MPGTYDRKDYLHREAKKKAYRSRAAFKLLELNGKCGLFRRGMRVLDLGCFPGGWLQVAAGCVGASGFVVGVDLKPLEPFAAVKGEAPIRVFTGDAGDEKIQSRIAEALGGAAHVVLSDMSPAISGIRFRDVLRSAELVELAFSLASSFLVEGGSFVAKTFPGAESDELVRTLRPRFASFVRKHLDATRKTSTEVYFVGKGFVGQQRCLAANG